MRSVHEECRTILTELLELNNIYLHPDCVSWPFVAENQEILKSSRTGRRRTYGGWIGWFERSWMATDRTELHAAFSILGIPLQWWKQSSHSHFFFFLLLIFTLSSFCRWSPQKRRESVFFFTIWRRMNNSSDSWWPLTTLYRFLLSWCGAVFNVQYVLTVHAVTGVTQYWRVYKTIFLARCMFSFSKNTANDPQCPSQVIGTTKYLPCMISIHNIGNANEGAYQDSKIFYFLFRILVIRFQWTQIEHKMW